MKFSNLVLTPPTVLAKAGDQQLEVRYLFDGTPGLDPPESVCGGGVGVGGGVTVGVSAEELSLGV